MTKKWQNEVLGSIVIVSMKWGGAPGALSESHFFLILKTKTDDRFENDVVNSFIQVKFGTILS